MPPTPPISTGAHDAKYEPVDVKTLGQGNFGTAKLMRHRASGQLFAIKYIERGDKIDENVKRELVNHRLLDHPNIIRFVEVLLTPTHLAIVMEYAAGGELFDRICGKGRFHEDEARFFFQQLISGLEYCHGHGVAHRDLKRENTLLDGGEVPRLKICDFGYSKHSLIDSEPKSTVGTPAYIAPEVLSRKAYDGKAADVWSCGCILYFMLTGSFPFDGKNFVQLQLMVQKTEPYFPPMTFSRNCEKMIKGMLMKDPTKLWTVDQVMKCSWFCVNYVPVQVPTTASNSRYFDEEDPALADFMSPDGDLVVKEGNGSVSETAERLRPIKQLNAFELINLAAFDVASIFDEDENTVSNSTRFMSGENMERVQAAVIKCAEDLGTVAKRKTQSRIMFEDANRGIVITMRTYQVVPGVCVYDFSRDEGGRDHFHSWFESLRDPEGPVGALISTFNGSSQ